MAVSAMIGHFIQRVPTACGQDQICAEAGQLLRKRSADARRGADNPDTHANPVMRADRLVQVPGHDKFNQRLTKVRETSPRSNPHLDMAERFSMTRSSIRNIQSSKSTW